MGEHRGGGGKDTHDVEAFEEQVGVRFPSWYDVYDLLTVTHHRLWVSEHDPDGIERHSEEVLEEHREGWGDAVARKHGLDTEKGESDGGRTLRATKLAR